MSDISACNGYGCPQTQHCYRFTCIKSKYLQSYADFQYIDGKCDYFWDNKDYNNE